MGIINIKKKEELKLIQPSHKEKRENGSGGQTAVRSDPVQPESGNHHHRCYEHGCLYSGIDSLQSLTVLARRGLWNIWPKFSEHGGRRSKWDSGGARKQNKSCTNQWTNKRPA